MRAVALDYRERRLLLTEIPEPLPPGEGEVLFRVREVGVCGTDRELARFRVGYAPEPGEQLIIGHEALGEVVETGKGVDHLRPGDWVAPMIRRGCSPACRACVRRRPDLCLTGKYRERGIWGLHGYYTEWAVDRAEDLVPISHCLLEVAVLIEPLSAVEKAVITALRMREYDARRALVLGAGPVGMLTALALQLRGLEVVVHSLEPADHPRADLLRKAGIGYVTEPREAAADLVFEATGAPRPEAEGLRWLAPGGIYAIIGVTDVPSRVRFPELILKNQTIFGSVNTHRGAFAQGAEDLARFDRGILQGMIRRYGFGDFEETIGGRPWDVAKVVHVIAE
jgi:glucose 1-dehydrogenase